MTPAIDRGFQRIGSGQVHFREAGLQSDELPLVMIHGGPGSSSGLVAMIGALAQSRHVVAPDLPGNGDSDPQPETRSGIAGYAEAVLEFLDAKGIDRFDLYGHHSGAQIASEISIARPASARRLVLDGLALFSPEMRHEFSLAYAPPMVPLADGAHLKWAWNFAKNLTRYFPYYRHDAASRLVPGTCRPPEAVTNLAIDLLKAWPTYHILYEAAFSHDLADRLLLVTTPTLVLQVEGDPLACYAKRAGHLLPASRTAALSHGERASVIDAFLKAD